MSTDTHPSVSSPPDARVTSHHKDTHPVSALVNLVNTVIGAGTLGLPYAFAKAGLIPALLIFFGMMFLTVVSIYYIIHVSDCTLLYSYGELAAHLFGPIGIILVALTTFIKCFGVLWAYVVLAGDYVISLLKATGISDDSTFVSRWFVTIAVAFFITIPLSWFRRVDSLKAVSSLALLTISFAILSVFISAFKYGPDDDDLKLDVVQNDKPLLIIQCFSTLSFAFGCHQNIPIIHGELRKKNASVMLKIVIAGISIVATLYLMCALSGYFTFGHFFLDATKKSPGNILNMYKDGDALVIIARLGTLITVLLSYPLIVIPCRSTLFNVIRTLYDIFNRPPNSSISSIYHNVPTQPPLIPPEWKDIKFNFLFIHLTRHHLATGAVGTCISLLTMTLSIFLNKVNFVFDLIGSTAGAVVAFVVPTVFYVRIRTNPSAFVNPKRMEVLEGVDYEKEYRSTHSHDQPIAFPTPAASPTSDQMEAEVKARGEGEPQVTLTTHSSDSTQEGMDLSNPTPSDPSTSQASSSPSTSPSPQPMGAGKPRGRFVFVGRDSQQMHEEMEDERPSGPSLGGEGGMHGIGTGIAPPITPSTSSMAILPSSSSQGLPTDLVAKHEQYEAEYRSLLREDSKSSLNIIGAWVVFGIGVVAGLVSLAIAILYDTDLHSSLGI